MEGEMIAKSLSIYQSRYRSVVLKNSAKKSSVSGKTNGLVSNGETGNGAGTGSAIPAEVNGNRKTSSELIKKVIKIQNGIIIILGKFVQCREL